VLIFVIIYKYIYFLFMDIYYFIIYFFLPNWDRMHYYIKVVESIQFKWTGNSGISRDLCNANTYRSIHEVLLFNSSPALDLKYPLRLPYIHLYLCSLHLHFEINYLQSQIFQPIRLTVSGKGGYSGHMINKMAIFEDTMSMCMNYYLFTFIMESFNV
jgi:hypothetical protein